MMALKQSLDFLYLGGSIALIGLALYLSHAAEFHGEEGAHTGGEQGANKYDYQNGWG